MNDYRLESPPILRDFLSYHETIKAHSQKTVDEYFLDLRNFFRYLKQSRDPSLRGLPLNEISIMDVDLDFVKKVTLTDIYAYMTYLSRDRVLHQNSDVSDYGLNAASRARKIATIRSFYNYLVNKAHLLDTNPCKDLDSPKIKKSLPKYLTLDESVQLLQSVDGQNRERDYCILTIFLNCGLRISELCGLDLQDIQDDALRVLGKGNKERTVYLTDVAMLHLQTYLNSRTDNSIALFAGKGTPRLTKGGIETLLKRIGRVAGVENVHPHRFRRTLATNLLDRGMNIQDVAMILGHADLKTTQIYCYITQTNVKSAYRKYAA